MHQYIEECGRNENHFNRTTNAVMHRANKKLLSLQLVETILTDLEDTALVESANPTSKSKLVIEKWELSLKEYI